MMFTEKEHLKFAALMDQAAKRRGLSQEQREGYLRKAFRFRHLARRAAALAEQGNTGDPSTKGANLRLVEPV
jgi:hypothetical protein